MKIWETPNINQLGHLTIGDSMWRNLRKHTVRRFKSWTKPSCVKAAPFRDAIAKSGLSADFLLQSVMHDGRMPHAASDGRDSTLYQSASYIRSQAGVSQN